MKLAACLVPRPISIFRHALAPDSIRPSTSTRAYHRPGLAGSDLGWDVEVLEEMRSGETNPGNRPPKTWASIHKNKSDPQASTTARGRFKYNVYLPKLTAAQKAKQDKMEELERGLDFYSHKSPTGPPHAAGSNFLLPLNSLPDANVRLKPPMLAYTADFDEAHDLLSCLGAGPMGLDLEWNFSHMRGPFRTALLQICSPSLILIIHLSAMSYQVPPLLKSILQDPKIIKTGVAIRNDALKLQKDYAIHTRNILELSNLAKLAQPSQWAGVNHLISLRDMTRVYLGQRLRKDSVRVSNWETYPLEAEQIEYAANDTFASLEVLRAISAHFKPVDQAEGLLGQLDCIDAGVAASVMDLDRALKLSAYDLYQEHMDLSVAAKQKQSLRVALREMQPQALLRPQSPQTASAKASSPKGNARDSQDEGITVTQALLAHDRAMNRWLYSQHSLTQVAIASNIKVTTVAQYLVKALLEAKAKALKTSGTKGGKGILDDFTCQDKLRLDQEMEAAGTKCKISRNQYRILAKSLGWTEVAQAP